ncbi:hypothetical protein PoB_007030900 [Plakobranchus ocellatus]|uniref:Uncharacterized protein n=1 Tax=Plakobranchus ocellatus TaxID=259542 RepID=A0AAV4DHT8_9GAST|nr:hypothetical protein PoB_007030900 [Plakobranchus ocellatus]
MTMKIILDQLQTRVSNNYHHFTDNIIINIVTAASTSSFITQREEPVLALHVNEANERRCKQALTGRVTHPDLCRHVCRSPWWKPDMVSVRAGNWWGERETTCQLVVGEEFSDFPLLFK